MLLKTICFQSEIQTFDIIRPSVPNLAQINSLIALFHKLLINKTTLSIFPNFVYSYLWFIFTSQDEGNMTVLLRLAFTTRIPQDIFVTWRNVFTSDFVTKLFISNQTYEIFFMCLVPPFVVKMTVSVMFVPRAAVGCIGHHEPKNAWCNPGWTNAVTVHCPVTWLAFCSF
jgi:hypothetical protein